MRGLHGDGLHELANRRLALLRNHAGELVGEAAGGCRGLGGVVDVCEHARRLRRRGELVRHQLGLHVDQVRQPLRPEDGALAELPGLRELANRRI